MINEKKLLTKIEAFVILVTLFLKNIDSLKTSLH